ncbi:MAG: GTPase Era [Polyangiaceae bacterium]|nr:GTPase Era [Polyangiaceae bacterium]
MRSGNVAIVGRTNVGKSTFLNAALGEPLAITSPLPQTTRDALLGVVTLASAQIAFIDTPGLHRPRTELGRRMNAAAIDALRNADLALVMTDTHHVVASTKELPALAGAAGSELALPEADVRVIEELPPDLPAILLINKVDRCTDKRRLLPTIERFASLRDFAAIVPASAIHPADVERILSMLGTALPERPPTYDPETLTDRPTLYFVREYVREQVLRQTGREVPHAVAVTVEAAIDRGDLLIVKTTIHVEKPGQRGILLGARGSRLREIGTAARERLETLLGRRVYLELFVRVTPSWRHVPRQLAELGYDGRDTVGRVSTSRDSPSAPAPAPPGQDHGTTMSTTTSSSGAAAPLQPGPSKMPRKPPTRPTKGPHRCVRRPHDQPSTTRDGPGIDRAAASPTRSDAGGQRKAGRTPPARPNPNRGHRDDHPARRPRRSRRGGVR